MELSDSFDTAVTGDEDGDFIDIKKILAVTTSVLNSVDCSALAVNCSAINREECGKVANTCGDCASGFVGVHGPDNSKCVLTGSTFDRRRRLAVGRECTSDAECVGGVDNAAFICTDGKCAEPMKNCFQNCNGHGDCTYRDTRTYTILSVCAQSDIYCEAMCKCEPTFAGKACELTSNEFTARQNMRIKLLTGLSEDNSARIMS
jgi:hypothetical protein